MTTVLALETSGSRCSVAVLHGANRFEHTRNVRRLHNEVVLSIVDQVCRQAAVHPRDFDLVTFAAGPGSFTGIRIAAAVAQGIAFGASALIAPVSSSLAMAHQAIRDLSPMPTFVVAMTRSRRDAYYVSGFAVCDGAVTREIEDMLCTTWPVVLNHWSGIAVGERPPWWPAGDGAAGGPAGWGWGGNGEIAAGLLIDLGLGMFARGEARDPSAGLPIYIADDSPWQPLTPSAKGRG